MTHEEADALAQDVLELLETKKISVGDAGWVLAKAESLLKTSELRLPKE